MSSIIWYLYDSARKKWAEGFLNSYSSPKIMEKPSRFRDFPTVIKENCIGCGACVTTCPSPNAIKLFREEDTEEQEGLTYPVIFPESCIRCGFCAEVCPTDPKTLECGENHLVDPKFNLIPSKRQYIVDDYLCIRCKKCMKQCPVDAISVVDDKIHVNQLKCISCGECLGVCPVTGAMKGVYVNNFEEQKKLIKILIDKLESYIESKYTDLRSLKKDMLLQYEIPVSAIWKEALKVIPDEEIALNIIKNTVDRLKIRVIDWDEDSCKSCQLCVSECPTGCIRVNPETNKVERNVDRCLRCSICYQTCPFSVIKYFISKFSFEKDEDGINMIYITVKTSDISSDMVME